MLSPLNLFSMPPSLLTCASFPSEYPLPSSRFSELGTIIDRLYNNLTVKPPTHFASPYLIRFLNPFGPKQYFFKVKQGEKHISSHS